ncbi:MAG: bifunctional precorrin-2 dehydrogenase/sirohydrochlorin ferrochelatase [Planctomycetota bacterium]|nr:MAG: bifunctional precorrin-2 dehydrogenase/sirohydrochlorin ferrochelatase [Planctomycetota bacterium]
MGKYYPVCLDLSGKKCLVVGGGKVALHKARDLLSAGADVTAAAPRFDRGFQRLKDVKLLRKAYGPADLRGCAVVIAATSDPEVNKQVCLDARRRKVLVNVVDMPRMCDFIVPAVLRRGDMTISVSTGGASPMLARKIKEDLGKRYPACYARYVRFSGEMRRLARQKLPAGKRGKLLKDIVYGRAWSLLNSKGVRAARQYVLKTLRKPPRKINRD